MSLRCSCVLASLSKIMCSLQYIKISNETDTELLVLIGEDPKALVLTNKAVKVGAGVEADLAKAAVNASVEATYEYELNTDKAITQKIRAKPRMVGGTKTGHSDKVRISRSAYVTVILFEDGLYKFIIESRKLEVANKFIIEQTDLQSTMPFKFSHTEPDV